MMTRRKKPVAVPVPEKTEAELRLEDLARHAQWLRERMGALAIARETLEGQAGTKYDAAIAFLQGQIAALYAVARDIDNHVSGERIPF